MVTMTLTTIAHGQLTETEMRQRLDIYDGETRSYCNRQALANWDVQTNVGDVAKEDAQVSEVLG